MSRARTQVAIVGAGPAGLMLGRMLERLGVESVILEARDRAYCEARIRAGVLEQGTRDALIDAGVGERLQRDGIVHGGIYLQADEDRRHLPMQELTGRAVTIYGQTEVVKDLISARLQSAAPLVFGVDDLRIAADVAGDAPAIHYRHGGSDHELRCDFIAGCDGFHGPSRSVIPDDVLRVWQRDYPFAWLGVRADVVPSTDELIY
ncbi:MAG: FAD-dependent monooxygenase, partial [Acidobacteriota bacterium]|nr:FAD-dependent monooxygenase [Acidobacteriota bacterium]